MRWWRSIAIRGIAAEAAIKYFVLGAIASGVLLYGMSMLYGLTGTLDLDQPRQRSCSTAPTRGLIIGVAFVVAAIAFKFGAVPFHMWVPDVYQGAPTSVTLYIATVSTLGSFALIVRLLAHGLAGLPGIWTQMLMAVAVLSLLVGNVVAIAQTNIKRMLAYSAIANAGFVLLGFATGQQRGLSGGAELHGRLRAHHAGLVRHDPDAEPQRLRAR